MNHAAILQNTSAFVKKTLQNAEGGHDWFHVHRVFLNAQALAKKSAVDEFIVALGSLLHDIADSKFHHGDETIGPAKARAFLETQKLPEKSIVHVVNIIKHISYKGGNFSQGFHSPELDVVQDADRLDAIGAIGIARCFHYGGFKDREIYNPSIAPNLHMSKAEYKKSTAPTINHFYEKLLLLKDRMNTAAGKKMAQKRHDFMEQFLEQFYQEWEGKS